MKETLLDTAPFLTFVVKPDPETSQIFKTPADEILDNLVPDTDPARMFLLKNSGFDISAQISRWIEEHKSAISEELSLEETRHTLIEQTVQDVVGFYFEYQSGQDVFPIDAEFREIEEKKTVFSPKYGVELKSVVLSDERDGAFLEGMNKAIEILTESNPNTIVILNSPSGWSGLKRDGKEINFPNNQSYVYWINSEGNLHALTIRTKADLLETFEKMGKSNNLKTKNERDRIKNVVREPVVIEGKNIIEALNYIEHVSNQKFNKVRKELLERDSLFNLNGEASEIVKNLKKNLLENITHLSFENIRLLSVSVGKAILDLEKLTLETSHISYSIQEPSTHYHPFRYQDIQTEMYQALEASVSQRIGCNGGGTNLISQRGVGGTSLFENLENIGNKYVKNCGVCGISINSFINKGYKCSNCHETYLGVC